MKDRDSSGVVGVADHNCTKGGRANCLANPEERLCQYTAIDEYTRLRYLGTCPEQSSHSFATAALYLRRICRNFIMNFLLRY